MIDAARRAERAWKRIQRNPMGVAFTVPRTVQGDGSVTPETQLPEQTVRVESDNRATPFIGVAGTTPTRRVVVYGIHDHETLPDTDMRQGYSFVLNNTVYQCVDVIPVPGERQGIFEAIG